MWVLWPCLRAALDGRQSRNANEDSERQDRASLRDDATREDRDLDGRAQGARARGPAKTCVARAGPTSMVPHAPRGGNQQTPPRRRRALCLSLPCAAAACVTRALYDTSHVTTRRVVCGAAQTKPSGARLLATSLPSRAAASRVLHAEGHSRTCAEPTTAYGRSCQRPSAPLPIDDGTAAQPGGARRETGGGVRGELRRSATLTAPKGKSAFAADLART